MKKEIYKELLEFIEGMKDLGYENETILESLILKLKFIDYDLREM
jgi:hypothetical protein